MHHVPLFIEVLHSPQSAPLQICRKIMASLFRQRIAPLPFASSVDEVKTVLSALKTKGLAPSIFVINTYWAEELLAQLDPLLGQTPVLFLMRDIGADRSGAPEHERILSILEKMTPRLSTAWNYSAQSAESMGQKAATGIVEFLGDGSFYHLERHSPMESSFLQMINKLEGGAANAQESGRWVPVNKISNVKIPTPALTPGSSATNSKTGVHGSLKQIGLSSLLMMLDMEKKNGELVITREQETVRLMIQRGRVVRGHAECNATGSALEGAEAVYYALRWTDGEFDFLPREVDMVDEVNAQTTQLLMEGARRLDTANSNS